jgi:hypothetical protein
MSATDTREHFVDLIDQTERLIQKIEDTHQSLRGNSRSQTELALSYSRQTKRKLDDARVAVMNEVAK